MRSAVAAAGMPVALLLVGLAYGLLRALRQERHGIFADQMREAEEWVDEHGDGTPGKKPEPAVG